MPPQADDDSVACMSCMQQLLPTHSTNWKYHCRPLLQASAPDRTTSSAVPPPPAPGAHACARLHAVAPARRACAPGLRTCSAARVQQRRRRGRLAVRSTERLGRAATRLFAAGRARQVGTLSSNGAMVGTLFHSRRWPALGKLPKCLCIRDSDYVEHCLVQASARALPTSSAARPPRTRIPLPLLLRQQTCTLTSEFSSPPSCWVSIIVDLQCSRHCIDKAS